MLLVLIFLIIPILGLPIYFLFYLFDKEKKGILYSCLIGLSLGLIAYYFDPKMSHDLFRHQEVVNQITGMNFLDFIKSIPNFNLEIIPMLYSYFISLFHNIDLLQFFVVSIGYSIIFYILYDYRKRKNLDKLTFLVTTLFTFFGFQHLYFISGLYCYIAIILFSLALYNEYVKGVNSKKTMIIYILTLFIHTSMFLPFAVLIIYKLFKNKLNYKMIILLIAFYLLSFVLVEQLDLFLNNSITNNLLTMYKGYTLNNDYYKRFYPASILFVELSKLSVVLLAVLLTRDSKETKMNGYIIILSIMTVLMLLQTRVAIRYVMIIQLIGVVPIMNYFTNDKRRTKIFMLLLMLALTCAYIVYYIHVFSNESFGNLSNNFIYNIFRIFNKN